MKIIFAGTSISAVAILDTLYNSGHDIILTLTKPDLPSGRGMKLNFSPVKKYALKHSIKIIQPISLKLNGKYHNMANEVHNLLNKIKFDIMIVVAYGLILPYSILKIPYYGCINIHYSLLPRWRGPAPVPRAIEAGDISTGVTIIKMDSGIDTGPIISQDSIKILPEDTSLTLQNKLEKLSKILIINTIQKIEHDMTRLFLKPQSNIGANYAPLIKKNEAVLDWSLSAKTLMRKINAFNPFPGAITHYISYKNKKKNILKIWKAHALSIKSTEKPGTILSVNFHNGILVACGKNVIKLLELQKVNKKKISAIEFINGFIKDIEFFVSS
ncbi:methionyl-tRNA formyltransferase [Candidatus Profftella armatura (Diaphorina cf. continua)]|uniref:Methionyl-tRNA formyltransferase n=1 Tax=Candidatus Profftella armatura (Diaphorina cf. continua) TaxID=2661583 RepID=A0A7R7AB00_9PROT|nr:methionyl-tRNA formyltransferase [Candidatus Profftella armatura (Diaphorina cf. continua)]BCG49520.1 methionyl-tRNA formyltransferase [Candidatus Profftella armatura (Diaphorina cf. continua)]